MISGDMATLLGDLSDFLEADGKITHQLQQ